MKIPITYKEASAQVSYDPETGQFSSTGEKKLSVGTLNFGSFETLEEAAAVAHQQRLLNHGEFAMS